MLFVAIVIRLKYIFSGIKNLYHVDLEKRGRCGGARETREPHVIIGRTVSKSETNKNLPAFQDLSGSLKKKCQEFFRTIIETCMIGQSFYTVRFEIILSFSFWYFPTFAKFWSI